MLPAGLLVVHDSGRGGEDDIAELAGREQLGDPLLKVAEADVVAGADDTALVEAAVELDNDLAVAVVVDLLEGTDVAWDIKSAYCRRSKSAAKHGRGSEAS